MITKEEFEEALEKVSEYSAQCMAAERTEYTCICCKKNRVVLSDNQPNVLQQEKAMWDNGSVERVSFGYGSVLDCDSFYMAICDECAKDLWKEGIVVRYSELRKKYPEIEKENYKRSI